MNTHLQNVSMRILMRLPGNSRGGRGNHKSRNQLTMLCTCVYVCVFMREHVNNAVQFVGIENGQRGRSATPVWAQ